LTGGVDTTVRVWPIKRNSLPIEVYKGHHRAIIDIVTQNKEKRIISLSFDKVIKVWDRRSKSCIQVISISVMKLIPVMQSSICNTVGNYKILLLYFRIYIFSSVCIFI
jgi:WD40 repeat protein